MKVLITGFNAFGSVRENPAEYVIARLRELGSQRRVVKARYEVLDVCYAWAEKRVREIITDEQPDLVVMVGVAAERNVVSLEQVAVNWDDAACADNSGEVRRGREILPGGAPRYRSVLPIEQCAVRLSEQHFKVAVSEDAGSFVCNHVYYCALDQLRMMGREMRCVFVHVPMPGKGMTQEGIVSTVAGFVEELVSAVREGG